RRSQRAHCASPSLCSVHASADGIVASGGRSRGWVLDPGLVEPLAVLTQCAGRPDCWLYAIRAGDNAWSIARWFGVSLDRVAAMNRWLGPSRSCGGPRSRSSRTRPAALVALSAVVSADDAGTVTFWPR